MKFTKVTYSRLFPLQQFSNERIEVEIQIDDHESEMAALELAKKTVLRFHEQSVKQDEERQVIDVKSESFSVPDLTRFMESVDKETTIEGLNSWDLFVSWKGKKAFKEYLEKRKKQLQNGN